MIVDILFYMPLKFSFEVDDHATRYLIIFVPEMGYILPLVVWIFVLKYFCIISIVPPF